MAEKEAFARTLRFAAFEIDLEIRELRKSGIRIRMEEKPYLILAALVSNAGKAVTRRALREKLWPNTFVGFEPGLNTAVNKLRQVLGDSSKSPRFVETLPRVGYRFIAPVSRGEPSGTANGKKMLLVLPFENLGGDEGPERFADGLTEETISQLGRMKPETLGVIARTSAIQYKGTKKTIGEIAKELHVSYVLEGSVRTEQKQLRITAQLIQASDQTHLWSESYEHEMKQVLCVQQSVARSIEQALKHKLLGDADTDFEAEMSETDLRGFTEENKGVSPWDETAECV